jgi:hypothetical protein
MMKTIIKIIQFVQMALAAFPAALALINKIRAAFGSDKVQEAIQAFNEFLDRVAPSVPTADSTDYIPAEPEGEQRRRFFRFMNRTQMAGRISDREVGIICERNLIPSYTEGQQTL